MANLSNINNKFLVTTGGNVGIGTTSPNSKLDVTGGDITVNTTGTGFMNFKYSGNSIGSIQTDGLDIKINATSDLVLLPGSNVGIGTTSPSSKLEVKMNDAANNRLGFTGDGSTTGAAMWTNWQTGNSYLDFRLGGTTDTYTKMRITNAGNVGIGATSPATKLQVANAGEVIVRSSMTAADGYRGGFEADNQHTGGTIWSMFSTNNSDGYFGGGKFVIANESMGGVDANTTSKFVIDGSGKVGIGTTSPSVPLDVQGTDGLFITRTSGGLATYIENDGGWPFMAMYQIGGGAKIIINTNGNSYFNGGNVGINTTSPSEKLHVVDTNAGVVRAPLRLQNEGTTTGTGVELYLTTKTSGGGGGNTTSILRSISTDTSGNCDMVFLTPQTGSASEKMRIKSNGNVGIGTTSPSSYNSRGRNLVISGSNDVGISIDCSSANSGSIVFADGTGGTAGYRGVIEYYHGDDGMRFFTSASEKMRITSGGNVGIGTNSPSRELDIQAGSGWAELALRGASGAGGSLEFWTTTTKRAEIFADTEDIVFRNTATNQERMRINSAGNVGIGSTNPTSITANTSSLSVGSSRTDITGGVIYQANGTVKSQMYWDSAGLQTVVNSGDARWYTGGVNDRLRITSAGDVLIGGTAIQAVGAVTFDKGGNGFTVTNNTTSSAGNGHEFQTFRRNSTQIGSIVMNGTTGVTYSTSSDYRLKEDLKDFDGLSMVSKIPVYDFKWKADGDRGYGVMAHELQEVLPQAVTSEKDAEKMQEVDYSKIVPLLVKSIQELKAEIEELKK